MRYIGETRCNPYTICDTFAQQRLASEALAGEEGPYICSAQQSVARCTQQSVHRNAIEQMQSVYYMRYIRRPKSPQMQSAYGSFTITVAGIDNNSPTLTVGTNVQDIIGLIKSHGKITLVGFMDNQTAV